MKIKTKIQKILAGILITSICFPYGVFASVHNYNIAGFQSSSFNNNTSISTGNKANIIIQSSEIYSGSTQVSDTSYNIADFQSNSFNNGLSVNTGKKAKVIVDKTLSFGSGDILTNDISYNIADFQSNSFNNGLSVNTGKKAKVIVDINKILTSTGSFIYGDTFYNIADFQSNSFNNGLSVNTGKKAKVLVSFVKWENGELTVEKSANYNVAFFQSDSFNNGISLNTGKKAKVEFKVIEEYYEDQKIKTEEGNDGIMDVTYTDIETNPITFGAQKDYTNSLKYIFQSMYKDNKSVNIKDISGNIYNKKLPSGTIIVGDKGLYQLAVKNTPDKKPLSYRDNNNLIITDGEIYKEETAILQVFLTGGVVVPPVLTYPYAEVVGTGSGATQKYILKTNYPIFKGMAYPNSILEVTIGGDKYYTKVDKDGLFEFKTKKINDGNISISFQYIMLEGDDKLSTYSSKKLKFDKLYNIEVKGTESLDFPYITSIYNDDYIYSDIFFMEGFANPGELDYKLTTITGTTLKTGKVLVNETTKKFSFILGDSSLSLPKGDYIIEVWQPTGVKERKVFSIMGDDPDNIGILNLKDFDEVPTLKPIIIGYSKENKVNNDTIRVYGCDITGDAGKIVPCIQDNREFLGTVNADKNGLFQFIPIKDLEDGKIYEMEFKNTVNMNINKKIVLKINTKDKQNIYLSQLTTIFEGLNINDSLLNISGFTLPDIEIDINGNTMKSDKSGFYSVKQKISGNELSIKYSSGGLNYEKKYNLIKSDKNINNTSYNYFQNFDGSNIKIIEQK